jgi:hypothetical protein
MPVPLPPATEIKYENATSLAFAAALLVQVDHGEWTLAFQVNNMNSTVAAYAPTGLRPETWTTAASLVIGYMKADPVWQAMSPDDRKRVTGPLLLQFLISAVGRLPIENWLRLNAVIATFMFGVFERRGTSVVEGANIDLLKTKNQMGQFVFERMTKKRHPAFWPHVMKVQAKLSQVVLVPVIYHGGWTPKSFRLPEMMDTAQSVFKSLNYVRTVVGKGKGINFLLDSARGFSGMPTSFDRRVAFILSAVLTLWSSRRTPCIIYSTTGDIPVIHSSLKNLEALIKKTRPAMFLDQDELVPMTWTYQLQSQTDMASIVEVHRPYVVQQVPHGSYAVFFTETAADSLEADKIDETALARDCAKLMLYDLYLGYCTAYGYVHFVDDLTLQKSVRGSLSGSLARDSGRLFKLGSSARMGGVVTS